MRPQLMNATLAALIKAQRTVCVEGPPGGGKTTIVADVAQQLGRQYIERHMPTMLVEDFGIPVIDGPTLAYKIPDWFPAKGSQHDTDRGGVLCFDHLHGPCKAAAITPADHRHLAALGR